MNEREFKEKIMSAEDADEIDTLCLQWLGLAADEQAPKVRAMMRSALDVVRKGIE